jgi:hypothetical protein
MPARTDRAIKADTMIFMALLLVARCEHPKAAASLRGLMHLALTIRCYLRHSSRHCEPACSGRPATRVSVFWRRPPVVSPVPASIAWRIVLDMQASAGCGRIHV